MGSVEPLEGRFHPFIDRMQVALSVAAAVGVFETPEPTRPFTHREVQHRVRAAAGFGPPPVTAGSACRAGVSGGLLTTYDGVRFSVSEDGDAFCAEIHHWSDHALRLYARHIERVLPRYARRFPAGQLRHELMEAVGRLVTAPILSGAITRDLSLLGLVPRRSYLSDEHIAAALEDVPDALQQPVGFLLRRTCSGEDRVLWGLLAHVTGVRFCELAMAGGLVDRTTALDIGGLAMLVDTSAMVSMALTPARRQEGLSCFIDAVLAGHDVVLLSRSVREYAATLKGAEAEITKAVKEVVDRGLSYRPVADEHSRWCVRAAWAHGKVDEIVAEAKRSGSWESLESVRTFVKALRKVPAAIMATGAIMDEAWSISPERDRQWRSEIARIKDARPDSDPVTHDAELLRTLEARRRQAPATIIVSVDRLLEGVAANVMGEQLASQVKPVFRPAAASRLAAGLAPLDGRPAQSWRDRSNAWAMGLGLLSRGIDPEEPFPGGALTFDDLTIVDGGFESEQEVRARHERIHRLVDDAGRAVSQNLRSLREAEEATLTSTDTATRVAAPSSDTEIEETGHRDVSGGAPARDSRRRRRIGLTRRQIGRAVAAGLRCSIVVLVAFATVLTASATGFDQEVAQRLENTVLSDLSGQQILVGGIGVVAALASAERFRRKGEVSTLVFDLSLIVLAVWSAGFLTP